MKTFNRGKLLRLAQQGRLELVESYHYDDMNGSSGMKKDQPAKPVELMPENPEDRAEFNNRARKPGTVYLTAWEFRSKSGMAYMSDESKGIITLSVHGNCSYELRIKP